MNVVADEGVDRQIVEGLRHDGHDVMYVAELAPGIDDEEVLRHANERDAILLTIDKDFGELVFRLGRVSGGVTLVRLEGLLSETKAILVARTCQQHGSEMQGAFSVISPGMLRIGPNDHEPTD